MLKFITKRVLKGILCVWFIWTMIFFLVRLTGDPTDWMLPDGATEQEIASLRTWEILPEEYRDIILECAQESALYQRNLWVRNDIFARATVIDSGCEIIYLDPEEKLRFQETVQPLYKKYCSDYLDLIKTIQNDTVVKTSTGE